MARTSWRRTGDRSSGFRLLHVDLTGVQAAQIEPVNTHLPVSETAAKRVRKKSAPVKARKSRSAANSKKGAANGPQLAPAGSLTRTKALLLAALKVWELKHRVSE